MDNSDCRRCDACHDTGFGAGKLVKPEMVRTLK
jgi:hypothetical protein